MSDRITSAHLDYLQRLSPAVEDIPAPKSSLPLEDRRLLQIRGIGRFRATTSAGPSSPGKPPRLYAEDILMAMYGAKTPIAFLCIASAGIVDLRMGTWIRPDERNGVPEFDVLDSRQGTLISALMSLYPLRVEETR